MDTEPIPPLFRSTAYAPHVRGSDTSQAAADSVRGAARGGESAVFGVLTERGSWGATDDELEDLLNMSHQTASARRRGLVLKGLVKDSGQRRNTRSGRKATVWILTTEEPPCET